MANQRHMEPAKVRAMGNSFKQVSSVLKAVSTVLEIQMNILKTTAFIGLFGGLAVERYLAIIKPRVDQLAKMTAQLADDAILSAADWEKAQRGG
ncbi:MAG: hypothetical protein LCI00_22995 [Chloroflexi bacterium]|nr:hypothetical protein [Chloroflexota bacterium]MCC6895922.1 hypothetical protein [Anaerolineae bacterium]